MTAAYAGGMGSLKGYNMNLHSLTDTRKLSNGVGIPCIGYGTWQTPDGNIAVNGVKEAIKAGYRHIDTAAAYGNEASVGQGIIESGVPRNEIFLTSKLANTEHGYEKTKKAFLKTLELLKTDYLDLYLIHWPNPVALRNISPDFWKEANAGTWKAMEEFYKEGKIKAIGVSNFCERHIDELMKTAEIEPMVNQISLSPGLTQDGLVKYCNERGIVLEAYSPLGTGSVLKVPKINEIAEKYGKSPAQICIRWSVQRGYIPLPKSVNSDRIRQNADVFDFEISERDMEDITTAETGRTARNPDTVNI
jgi:diketogulonate reductase-like aldo/keto reductase